MSRSKMINLSKILFFSTLLLLIGCNTTMEPIQQSTEFTYQEKDIQFFQDGYSNGEFTVSEVVQSYIDRINEIDKKEIY